MATEERLFPMRVVVRRTGLKPDLLRAWERRYGAIRPSRTEGSRRLYSDEDVRRLLLLQKAVAAGYRIGDIARLPTEDLSDLARSPEGTAKPDFASTPTHEASAHLETCLAAIQRLNGAELGLRLEQAAFSLSRPLLIDRLVLPLMEEMGRGWETGVFRISHEHLAASAIRSLLGRLLIGTCESEGSPLLIATTPARQLHELGALAAAATAAAEGWDVAYLGPNLPAEEILAAVNQTPARALALSLIYPADDARLPDELQTLGRHLPAKTTLLVGGRAGSRYIKAIEAAGGKYLASMQALRDELRALREPKEASGDQ